MFTHTEVTLSWNTWKNVCTRTNAARSSLLSPYTVAPSSFDRWGALRLPITITYGILSVFTAPCIWHPALIYYRLRIAGYILTTRASDVIERNGARGAATGCVGTKCEWTRSSGNEMPHSIRGQQWRVCMRAPRRRRCVRERPSHGLHGLRARNSIEWYASDNRNGRKNIKPVYFCLLDEETCARFKCA